MGTPKEIPKDLAPELYEVYDEPTHAAHLSRIRDLARRRSERIPILARSPAADDRQV
jgi:hypothetical protein